MQPLVLQLQADCLDSGVPILEVLRKALVVARKLSLPDAQRWIEKELNGYKTGDTIPPHRILRGEVRLWNPYNGWIPMIFEDSEEAARASTCYLGQPVGELEDLVKHDNGAGTLHLRFSPEVERRYMESMDVPLQPTRHLSRAAITGVLDAVRNMVLDWCLQMEKQGILGEGLVFSAKEKEAAANSDITVNFNGPVSNSQIQQNSPHAVQSMTATETNTGAIAEFARVLKEHLPELRLDRTRSEKLQTEVRQIETQLASANPDRGILRESLRTIRTVLEGCAGSLIASGLLFELSKLLSAQPK